jgi:hypothetical protein
MQNDKCKMHSAFGIVHSALPFCIGHFTPWVHFDILTTSVYSWI